VGASGVGKTQILKSIMKVKNISNGYAYNGVEWDFHFSTDDGGNYQWTGKFETVKEIEKQEFKEEEISGNGSLTKIPTLLDEKLYLDKKLVFERKESNVTYEDKDVPKIAPHKSVLTLFTKEDKIAPVKTAFNKIFLLDYNAEKDNKIEVDDIPIGKAKEIGSLEMLEKTKNMNVSLLLKLAWTHLHLKENFETIISEFKDVFSQIEDVRFKLLEKQDIYELQIKERGTDWVSQGEISSGMLKTLLHIVEMKLMARGHIILIDEFENSLGVNCIDAVAGDLVNPERNLQYIITSHHPYIINNIGMKYWKVVMRKGAKVSTKNAAQLKLGTSKHEAFKQLMNLEEFAEGIG
jgi:ABC-type dipeptide/oligopeptide/nickel transport system ATPase subunit